MKRALLVFVPVVAAACSDSVTQDLALEEPFRVGYNVQSSSFAAQFFRGELPAPSGGPAVIGVDVGSSDAIPGDVGRSGYTVRLDGLAFSVAVRLKDRTNGYWIARVDQVETLYRDQVSASLYFDVAPTLGPGKYELELSGIDGNGHYGPRSTAPVNVVPRFPAHAPAVVTLRWSSAVDLDLQLRAPDGTLLSSKRPFTSPAVDGGAAPGAGYLQGDSLGACIDDGYREEDVVFLAAPAAGKYSIYVNPFSLCGRPGTTYELTVRRGGTVTNRWFDTVAAPEVQAGGYGLGTLVSDIVF